MSEIFIRRSHGLAPQDAKAAADSIVAKLQESFDLNCKWNGNVLSFKRTGVTGELVVEQREMRMRVRLGFLLLALKPRIETEIHRYFDRHFGPDPGPRV